MTSRVLNDEKLSLFYDVPSEEGILLSSYLRMSVLERIERWEAFFNKYKNAGRGSGLEFDVTENKFTSPDPGVKVLEFSQDLIKKVDTKWENDKKRFLNDSYQIAQKHRKNKTGIKEDFLDTKQEFTGNVCEKKRRRKEKKLRPPNIKRTWHRKVYLNSSPQKKLTRTLTELADEYYEKQPRRKRTLPSSLNRYLSELTDDVCEKQPGRKEKLLSSSNSNLSEFTNDVCEKQPRRQETVLSSSNFNLSKLTDYVCEKQPRRQETLLSSSNSHLSKLTDDVCEKQPRRQETVLSSSNSNLSEPTDNVCEEQSPRNGKNFRSPDIIKTSLENISTNFLRQQNTSQTSAESTDSVCEKQSSRKENVPPSPIVNRTLHEKTCSNILPRNNRTQTLTGLTKDVCEKQPLRKDKLLNLPNANGRSREKICINFPSQRIDTTGKKITLNSSALRKKMMSDRRSLGLLLKNRSLFDLS